MKPEADHGALGQEVSGNPTEDDAVTDMEATGKSRQDQAEDAASDATVHKSAVVTDASATNGASATPSALKKRKRPFLKALSLLVLLALVFGAGWLGWQYFGSELLQTLTGAGPVADRPGSNQQVTEPWRQPLAAIENRLADVAELENQVNEMSARYRQLSSQYQDAETGTRNQLAEVQLRLNSYGERIRQLSTTTRKDWLLAEAEYLLRLANQRVLTERQTKNALALMESADDILRDLDDVDLYPVRKALADDITALRMTGIIDREGLYLKLDAVARAIDNLTLVLDLNPVAEAQKVVVANQAQASWTEQILQNTKAAFKDLIGLVRIQRRDVPLEPLLSGEQEMNLRYNLRASIEQSQLALLREEQVIYEAGLAKAEQWVSRHFELDPASEAVLTELRTLRNLEIVQPLPSVSRSISALHDYIRLWHNRYPVEEKENSR